MIPTNQSIELGFASFSSFVRAVEDFFEHIFFEGFSSAPISLLRCGNQMPIVLNYPNIL